MLQLLIGLIEAWSELYTIDEVWNDQTKLSLLLTAHRELNGKVVVPKQVRDYYDAVFMRQLWD